MNEWHPVKGFMRESWSAIGVHPDFWEGKAMAFREAQQRHYVKCAACGETVCGDYAAGKESCRFMHEDCWSGETILAGTDSERILCGFCY